ncbi:MULTISPECIES: serine O-acetyltransferase [unclassified Rhodococcus (in: high G+C Gram-positive bacteria)]|uniref:serine O-acetyltransferase n=1 Tax=unclassified Rhodococcus (in: high G+C Gram-positive bacteria) TaxID=192944 RepID=UPI0021BF19B5|nr:MULTISPECIES: serine acetyltransferase [unclassified Rhodococcus (in: high G+C Gram-positive bacteria)]MDQ1181963.1 serine O-acetyltransferase [Rhodococcus sp. SORGH_AS_0301]
MVYTEDKRALLIAARIYSAALRAAVDAYVPSDVVTSDVDRAIVSVAVPSLLGLTARDRFAYLVGALPEFRSVVHLRLAAAPFIVRRLLRRLYPGKTGLVLVPGPIGPGLFVHHGGSTIVDAASIGRNFWVNQNVTIGHSTTGRPTIGDDVTVATGAVVAGGITIGDGAWIGPNVVVTRDVPPGATLVAARPVDISTPSSVTG